MSEEAKHTKLNSRKLKWKEHIRMRPGMFIGKVNEKG